MAAKVASNTELLVQERAAGLGMLSGAWLIERALGLCCHLLAAAPQLCTQRVCGGFCPRGPWGTSLASWPSSEQRWGVGSSQRPERRLLSTLRPEGPLAAVPASTWLCSAGFSPPGGRALRGGVWRVVPSPGLGPASRRLC